MTPTPEQIAVLDRMAEHGRKTGRLIPSAWPHEIDLERDGLTALLASWRERGEAIEKEQWAGSQFRQRIIDAFGGSVNGDYDDNDIAEEVQDQRGLLVVTQIEVSSLRRQLEEAQAATVRVAVKLAERDKEVERLLLAADHARRSLNGTVGMSQKHALAIDAIMAEARRIREEQEGGER